MAIGHVISSIHFVDDAHWGLEMALTSTVAIISSIALIAKNSFPRDFLKIYDAPINDLA